MVLAVRRTNVIYTLLEFIHSFHFLIFFFSSGQHVSLNATYSLNTTYEHHDSLQEDEYTGDVGDDGYQQGEYAEDYGQDAEVPEDPMEYNEELGQEEEGYQDGVLDIQINEPLDGEFQVSFCTVFFKCTHSKQWRQ